MSTIIITIVLCVGLRLLLCNGYFADLRWVFCGPTSAARFAKYPLVGPQVRKIPEAYTAVGPAENGNRTFRPFTGRFAPRTFRPCTFRPLTGRFAPDCGRFAPVCFSMCLLFFRTPERDGRVDRQNCYQYLASVW